MMHSLIKNLFWSFLATGSFSCSAPAYLGSVKIAENNGERFGPSEPSIAVSPVNPDIVVAGSILDRVHYSNDGGRSFSHSKLSSPLGVYGDPVVWADHDGMFYYVHLGNPDGGGRQSGRWLESLVIHQSADGGKTWDQGSAIGTNPPKNQDKPWISSNPNNGELVVTWTEFDKYGSNKETDRSRIRFSLSKDQGRTWTPAMTISDHEGNCLDDDLTPEGAVPGFGPSNEIYVCWAYDQKLWFDKSTNGGNSWLSADKALVDQPGGWSLDVPGVGRANGMPVVATDLSQGKYRGSIYICWADLKNGEKDMDIWLLSSRDGGNSWSDRIRVNQDKTSSIQFFPWISVDQSTGHLYLVYYDRSRHTDLKTDVVVAYSKNGGKSFKELRLDGNTFTPPGKEAFFGDYNNISAAKGVVRPVWTSYLDKKLSVWTALVEIKSKKRQKARS